MAKLQSRRQLEAKSGASEQGDAASSDRLHCLTVEEVHNFIAGGMVVHNCPFAWTLRGGSAALPEYPLDRAGSQKRWNAKWVTYSTASDGSRKKVPYLKNEEEFYRMIEPLVYRRLRNEPDLIRDLGPLTLEEETIEVELDEAHQRFYLAVLKTFSDWYVREIERRRREGKSASIPPNEILVKLGYLIRGVSQPWRMKDPGSEEGDFQWPEYPRQPTAIHRAAMARARQEVEEGYQVIIFADNREGLDVMREGLEALGVTSAVYHGGVAHAQRDELIERFRAGDFQVLLGNYSVAAEGLNLGNAARVILTEYNWSPSTVKQAVARITRPDQRYTPRAIYLTAPGTIQDYVRRLAALKQEAMDAALDRIRQTSGGEDVPDLQQYAFNLVGNFLSDPDQRAPRQFELELDDSPVPLLSL